MRDGPDRPAFPPYADEEEWTPGEVTSEVEGTEQAGVYPRATRAGVRAGRRRLGRSMTLRGLLALLVLLLLAVVLWWSARALFPPPVATPTAAAAATSLPLATPTPAITAAATVSAVTSVPSPTPTPQAAIAVGQMVQISGTEEEGIRFRSGPGLDYATLDILQEGVRLKVLEGPEQADGFAWWRLEMEDGTVGWAAGDWLEPISASE
ncbi:MAG: SH3 domain-containing protein [Anaerolineae bacterium]|nr:SH3 domain-containing protein [Anaerolineae bacterium]